MKVRFSRVVIPFILTFIVYHGLAQKPFRNEIAHYKKIDSIQSLPDRPILFVGSSSFRLWKNLPGAFRGYPVVNRAFGGSTIPHVDMYADEIIFPYKPAQIVFYCGENDLTQKGVTADTVYARFRKLFERIRTQLPGVSFVFVSLKPSPSRASLLPEVKRANGLIAAYLAEQQNAAYVDVFSKMINAEGKPMEKLFSSDMLHMNSDGYMIWQEALAPVLLK